MSTTSMTMRPRPIEEGTTAEPCARGRLANRIAASVQRMHHGRAPSDLDRYAPFPQARRMAPGLQVNFVKSDGALGRLAGPWPVSGE